MLEIRLFGSPQVIVDGKPQPKIPTRKGVVLLARLVLNPSKPQDRNALAFELWPDVPETRARRNLNTEVWRLKQTLGEAIVADAKCVQFLPETDCLIDALAFESVAADASVEELEAAIATYRGDFLAGYYEDWALVKREFYQDRLMHFLDQSARRYQSNSSPRKAIECVRRILSYNPLHEESHQRLMRLFAQAGDYPSAIQQYRQCAEALERELSIKPMPETEALLQRIVSESQRGTGEPTPIVQPEKVFVGRRDALGALDAKWAEALQGRLQSVIVTGESGIGKTRLVEYWLESVKHHAVILRGHCYEVDRRAPYRPLIEMFHSAVREYGDTELKSLPAAKVDEIGRLIPDLVLGSSQSGPAVLTPAQARERLVNALTMGLRVWSSPEKPLIVFLDDMQWADDETMDIVRVLLRSENDAPLLFVATHRPDPLAVVGDGDARIKDLESSSLALNPLSRGEVADMIRRMGNLPDAPTTFAERIHAETEGNPLFVVESLRGLFASGTLSTNADGIWTLSLDRPISDLPRLPLSPSLRQTIMNRVERLNAEQRELLALAATIGREFDVETLRAVSGMDDLTVRDSVGGLIRYGLARPASPSERFDFSHIKIQEALYSSLNEERRTSLHLQIARYLEAQDDGRSFEQLAHHFQRGGDRVKALTFFQQAGEQAMQLQAYRVGAKHFESAVLLCVDSNKLFELRMSLYLCLWTIESDHEKLHEILEQALHDAEQTGRLDDLARVNFYLGLNLVSRGRWDQARAVLLRSLEYAVESGAAEIEMKVRIELSNLLGHLLETDEALSHASKGLEIARRLGDFRMEGRARWDMIEWRAAPEERAREGMRIINTALQKDALELIIDLGSDSVGLLWRAGNLGGAIELGERILNYGRERGIELPLIRSVQRALSRVYCEIGAYEHAFELAHESLRVSRLSNYRYGEMRALACLAASDAGMGNLADALPQFRRAADLCAQFGSKNDTIAIQLAAAKALLWFGNLEQASRAENLLREVIAKSRSLGAADSEGAARSYLSQIHLSAKRSPEALQESRQAIEIFDGMACKNFLPEPFVYFYHYLVLRQTRDENPASFLRRARDLLFQRAATLPPRLRRSYLRRVPVHLAMARMKISAAE
ncbi:MAG: AAA family ATPase [Anaerolineales bacterium]|nr:AAA family ATPase [Anaerolineales bacterium]